MKWKDIYRDHADRFWFDCHRFLGLARIHHRRHNHFKEPSISTCQSALSI